MSDCKVCIEIPAIAVWYGKDSYKLYKFYTFELVIFLLSSDFVTDGPEL